MASDNTRKNIEKEKLLIVEGNDDERFFNTAIVAFGVADIQVFSVDGNRNFPSFLELLPKLHGYENVKTIVIARDAETNADATITSITKSLKVAGFAVPAEPFVFEGTSPRVAFMLLPGPANGANDIFLPGALENLCLEILRDDSTLDCVNTYVTCLNDTGQKLTHPHKTKLLTYLAGMNNYVGKRIGEAAQAGAFDWNHAKLKPFRTILCNM